MNDLQPIVIVLLFLAPVFLGFLHFWFTEFEPRSDAGWILHAEYGFEWIPQTTLDQRRQIGSLAFLDTAPELKSRPGNNLSDRDPSFFLRGSLENVEWIVYDVRSFRRGHSMILCLKRLPANFDFFLHRHRTSLGPYFRTMTTVQLNSAKIGTCKASDADKALAYAPFFERHIGNVLDYYDITFLDGYLTIYKPGHPAWRRFVDDLRVLSRFVNALDQQFRHENRGHGRETAPN